MAEMLVFWRLGWDSKGNTAYQFLPSQRRLPSGRETKANQILFAKSSFTAQKRLLRNVHRYVKTIGRRNYCAGLKWRFLSLMIETKTIRIPTESRNDLDMAGNVAVRTSSLVLVGDDSHHDIYLAVIWIF